LVYFAQRLTGLNSQPQWFNWRSYISCDFPSCIRTSIARLFHIIHSTSEIALCQIHLIRIFRNSNSILNSIVVPSE
jgi:hypothetical protein